MIIYIIKKSPAEDCKLTNQKHFALLLTLVTRRTKTEFVSTIDTNNSALQINIFSSSSHNKATCSI